MVIRKIHENGWSNLDDTECLKCTPRNQMWVKGGLHLGGGSLRINTVWTNYWKWLDSTVFFRHCVVSYSILPWSRKVRNFPSVNQDGWSVHIFSPLKCPSFGLMCSHFFPLEMPNFWPWLNLLGHIIIFLYDFLEHGGILIRNLYGTAKAKKPSQT